MLCCALALGTSTGGTKGPDPAWAHWRKTTLWSRTSCLAQVLSMRGLSREQNVLRKPRLCCAPAAILFLHLRPRSSPGCLPHPPRQNSEASDLCQTPKCSTLTPPNEIYPMAISSLRTGIACWWPLSKVHSEDVQLAHTDWAVQLHPLGGLEEPEWLEKNGLTDFQINQVP